MLSLLDLPANSLKSTKFPDLLENLLETITNLLEFMHKSLIFINRLICL